MALHPRLRCIWLLASLAAGVAFSDLVSAADPAFVGILALTADEDVAKELKISAEVQGKLAELIDARESEVSELALEIKDLPFDQRTARLAPFVAESEKLGLALLSDEQKSRLQQIRISKAGWSTLAEPKIAAQIELSQEQQDQIAKLTAEMAVEGSKGSELERLRAKATAERQLKAVLTKEQQAKWEALAGRAGTALAGRADTVLAGRADTEPPDGGPAEVAKVDDRPQTEAGPATRDPSGPIKDLEDVKLRFNFNTAPWKEVIDWFAEQSDLSLQVPSGYPAGTFNYRDNKTYTLREAMDVINRALFSWHGHLLVRRERLLVVWNLEEPIPHDWLVPISPAELDEYGEFELVRCLFEIKTLTPEEAEAEANKLKGSAGTVVLLSRPRQLYVTDLAGKVRAIRDVIDPVIAPEDLPQLAVLPLGRMDPTTVQNVISSLLANKYPPVQLSVDPMSGNLIVRGSYKDLEIIKTTLDQLQRDGTQLKVFKLKRLDPSEAMLSLNNLSAGETNPAKLHADSVNMRLSVRGTKSQIEFVEQWLSDMGEAVTPAAQALQMTEASKSTMRMIPLTGRASRNAAEQVQVLASGILPGKKIRVVTPLNTGAGSKPAETFTLPRSDAAARPQQPAAQGSPDDRRDRDDGDDRRRRDRDRDGDGDGDRDRDRRSDDRTTEYRPGYPLRILPLALIAVVEAEGDESPEEEAREEEARSGDQDAEAADDAQPVDPLEERFGERVVAYVDDMLKRQDQNGDGYIDSEEWKAGRWSNASPPESSDLNKDDRLSKEELCLRIQDRFAQAEAEPAKDNEPEPAGSADSQEPQTDDEVVIIITPNGWIVRSQDTEALDKIEEMLSEFVPEPGTKEFSIFYLKFARAENAAAMLNAVLTGTNPDSGGGNAMGNLAAGMMGNMMGGMFGNMFGGGGGGGDGGFTSVTTSGTVSIVADPRLNALFVKAASSDLDTVEKLLELIDQPEGPEAVQTTPAPRFIPVLNANVEEVATTVREVYATKIASGANQQQRQPSPEDFLRALTRGRGGSRGGGGGNQQLGEEQKMTIGVDVASNTLIVAAPDYLFAEVKALVSELDAARSQQEETVSVVKLQRTNPDVVARSLSTVLGSNVTTNRSSSSSSSSNRSSSSSSGTDSGSRDRDNNSPFGGRGFSGFGGGFPGGFGGGGFGGGGFPGGFSGRSFGDRGSRGGFSGGGFGGGGFPGSSGFGGGGGDRGSRGSRGR